MATIHLTDTAEWEFSEAARAHLDHTAYEPQCHGCMAARAFLPDLRGFWEAANPRIIEAMWSECDTYGPKGTVPGQGYDWSGIRDASPATLQRMWQAVQRAWQCR